MKRNQVFVRAQAPSGKWVSADVLDLDDYSFRAFVIDMLKRSEVVVAIKDTSVKGNHITYRTTKEVD